MKKITRIAALAVLVLGVAAMLQPANAICGSPRTFGSGNSYIYTPGCGYNGCDTAGGATSMTDARTGVFWAITSGDPAVGPGNDSGSFAFSASSGLVWSGFEPGYPVYIPGNVSWAFEGVDNCIDSSANRCMAILLMDNDADTGAGAFALLTDEPDNLFNYSFDQGGPINLTTMPGITISNSAKVEGTSDVAITISGISLSDIGGGLYLDANCPNETALITGYQIYAQTVGDGDAAPSGNNVADWTAVSPEVPLGSPGTATVDCSAAGDLYIAAGVKFDSGFENTWVSGPTTRVECTGNLADPDDIDIERKPRNREKPRSRSRGR